MRFISFSLFFARALFKIIITDGESQSEGESMIHTQQAQLFDSPKAGK